LIEIDEDVIHEIGGILFLDLPHLAIFTMAGSTGHQDYQQCQDIYQVSSQKILTFG
jgi:hypothetical protein